MVLDKKGREVKIGNKVRWYDPERKARDLSVKWEVVEIIGDDEDYEDEDEDDRIVVIVSEYGSEAEVFGWELEIIG